MSQSTASPLAGADPGMLLASMEKDREQASEDRDAALKSARSAMAKMQESAPQPVRTPPEQYSGLALAIASLGGLLTHTPLTTSANAMAGVINAYNEGDAQKSKEAYEQWKAAHDASVKTAELELKAYDEASKRMQNDPRGYQSMMLAQTAAFKNSAISKAANDGNWQLVDALVAGMRNAVKGLQKAGDGFDGSHETMMAVHTAETEYEDAVKSGDPEKVRAAIDNLNESRGQLATAVEDGTIKTLPKGVTVSSLRKPIPGGTSTQKPATAMGLLTQNAQKIADAEIKRREAAGETLSDADKAKIENEAIQAALRDRTAFSQTVGFHQGQELQDWLKNHPNASLEEFARAERAIQGKDMLPPAQIVAMEARSQEMANALSAMDKMREAMDKTIAAAGGLGRVIRPFEAFSNITGLSDSTDYADFKHSRDQVELLAGNLLRSKDSAALSKQTLSLLNTIVRGGNWGDTKQNVTSALDDLERSISEDLLNLNNLHMKNTGNPLPVLSAKEMPSTAQIQQNPAPQGAVIRYDAQGNRIP